MIVREAMRVMSADAASVMLPGIDGKLYIAHAYGIDPEIQVGSIVTPEVVINLATGREYRSLLGHRTEGRR